MKCKKMIALLLLITSIMLSMSGCFVEQFLNRTFEYSFTQNLDNVEKVEIRAYEYDPYDTEEAGRRHHHKISDASADRGAEQRVEGRFEERFDRDHDHESAREL